MPGEWDDADRLSAAAVRSITANYPYMLLMNRAELEVGRGDFAVRQGAPRRRPAVAARGQGPGDLRRVPGRAGAVGAPVDRRRRARGRGPHRGHLATRRSAPSLVQRQGPACRGRARRPRPGPARRRRHRRLARQSGSARHDRPQRRGHGVIDHTERRRLAGPRRSRVRPRPRPRSAGHVVRRGQHLGSPRTPGVGGVLPLARDRNARRRRRTPHGRCHPAAVRTHRCYPGRGRTIAARGRAARPTSTARPRRRRANTA